MAVEEEVRGREHDAMKVGNYSTVLDLRVKWNASETLGQCIRGVQLAWVAAARQAERHVVDGSALSVVSFHNRQRWTSGGATFDLEDTVQVESPYDQECVVWLSDDDVAAWIVDWDVAWDRAGRVASQMSRLLSEIGVWKEKRMGMVWEDIAGWASREGN